jgi:hypothetical protein
MDDVHVLFLLSLAVPLFCGVAGIILAFIDRKLHPRWWQAFETLAQTYYLIVA